MTPAWVWIVVAICGVFSMFFSSADMVYSVVDKAKLEKRIEKNKTDKKAKIALSITNDYETSISAILFGNNIANILASSLVTIIGTRWNSNWGATIATIIFTIIVIILAEFTPKALSKRFSLILALAYAYPVLITKYILFIFVWPISKLFILIGKLFKKRSIEEDVVDGDILNEMVDTIEESGDLDSNEAEIVRGAIDLNDTQAFEVMTPRVDIFAIDVNDDIEKIIKEREIFKHSRIPVYEDTIDNIIGILPTKAIVKSKFNHETIDIKKMIYQPLAIPRNTSLLNLLNSFKKSKIHIAVVIDEYGGTDGIVTMEDILEEIVGDIFDEMDDADEESIDQGNGKFIVDGSMNIDDFFDLIEYKKEFETDYSTVTGFCQEILKRFAQDNDEFIFADRYYCRVLKAEEFTVEKLEVIDKEFSLEENSK